MSGNIYKSYTPDQLEDHFSNFLIDSWSYSKVSTFARNEKDFERTYIYREEGKRSATSISGNAYHKALELFFNNLKEGKETPPGDLELEAYAYIDNVEAFEWRLQKTTPTIEECRIAATKNVTALLHNFLQEKDLYLEDLEEVLGIEFRCEEWVVCNGVDIPLPCHANIDLVVRLKDGRIVIIDHKSRKSFTDEGELALITGKQAITYVLSYEAVSGNKVDEVWFIENKISANKDKSPQLRKFVIKADQDNRRLFEALLYEPLRRMIEAVSDPDYVYTLNDSDTLADRAELYNFWAKTMIAEADDFKIPDDKKDLIAKRQKKIRDAETAMISPNVITQFKKKAASFITYDLNNSDMTNSEKIEHTLRTFGILVKVAHEISGYSSNTYLLEVSAGVKIANIVKYKLDIASALNVSSVRVSDNLFVYEGQSYLAIEANKKREKDLLYDEKYLDGLKLPIGVDNFGQVVRWNLGNPSTPHALICGATGSGKSVCIRSTICYALAAGVDNVVIFDPKYEFCEFASDKVRVYNEIEEIEEQMKLLVEEMQNRVRNKVFNIKTLVVFDEFADAVASSRSGNALKVKVNGEILFEKSLEENLKMLLQKGRSSGFRIVAATQRASVKVITGDAKVNFPVQICFRVPKEIDSKVVLDEAGAEALAGCGDGLIKSPDVMDIVRFQGFYKA